ncbi:hypothetical protein [Laspinema olomoucense]|uniref:hypothetical protein n=1 Tax=Laspinema olomoucense TaxID=3231600 RepID=UPI0021BB4ACB|nr:hypothetical protein [Laspinema sp. D3a]MCT7990972.1 hypothetical protein [Laspinema sp. D3a]
MTSEIPSKTQSDSGLRNQLSKYFGGLFGIFLIWTLLLVPYTLIQQHDGNAIIWWQQGHRVSYWQTSDTSESIEISPRDPANPNVGQVDDNRRSKARSGSHPDKVDVAEEKVKSEGCSAKTAVAIGAVVTIGISALLVPPPVAFVAGSAAASGLCWILAQGN